MDTVHEDMVRENTVMRCAISLLLISALAACAVDPVAPPGAEDTADPTPSPAPARVAAVSNTESSNAVDAASDAATDGSKPIEALEARKRKLEEAVAAARALRNADEPPDVPTNAAGLMGLFEKGDAPSLSVAIEELLLLGEPGFAEVFGFFRRCDIERQKILDLTHEPQFIFALLRIVATRPDETAAFCMYVMDASASMTDSFIRREVFNFLPVFLNHHDGRYPEVRERLERDILHQLASGGDWLYKVRLAMRDLEFHPPVTAFEPILRDSKREAFHATVIDYLATRGEEALPVIAAYIEFRRGDARAPAMVNVFRAIAAFQGDAEHGPLNSYLDHGSKRIRALATLTYFQRERPAHMISRVHTFLNSDADLADKRKLITTIRRKNPAMATALFADLSPIEDEQLRSSLERLGEAFRKATKKKDGGE